jgi:O-antigen ligase
MMKAFDRHALRRYSDWWAVAIAIALPWSTSLTAAFIFLWLITFMGSWNMAERFRPWTLAGTLPVLLWGLGFLGMLWANVPLSERLAGLGSFHKFLFIPFFAVQFRDSDRGIWVFVGFLISCTVLLAVSWAIILLPNLPWRGRTGWIGIPVKDYLSQGAMFTLCIMGLAEGAVSAWKNGNRRLALTFMILATIFFANILYASTGRTTVLALAVLIPLFCFMRLGWKSAVCLLIAVALFAPVAWSTSQQLRERMIGLLGEVQSFDPDSSLTSTGFRLEFWRKSIVIIEEAPIFGHGTGSTREEFRKLAVGQTGMAGMESANPHNQILATAIQLGLIGAIVLLAMWIAHALFFFSRGLV